MKWTLLWLTALLTACASTPADPPPDVLAIRDYVAVASLEEVDRVRTTRQATHERIGNKRFVFFHGGRQSYLVEFTRDCWELYDDTAIRGDIRHEGNFLRPGIDTIRGCRIKSAYKIDDAQLEEIRNIGDAPTGG